MTEDEQIGCGHCCQKRRVLNASEFEVGQHIFEPGRNKLKYKEKKHNVKAIYFHHSIIAGIKHIKVYQVTLELIHYTDVTGIKKGSIKKKEEERDLKYDEIYIVEYNYSKYTADEIVRRAQSQVKKAEEDGLTKTKKDTENDESQFEEIKSVFGHYNLFKSNCEHFATWCVLGKQDCFQLKQKRRILLYPLRISSGVAGIFILIISCILQLFTSEDKTYIALLSVAGIYLFYLFYRFLKLTRNRNYKHLCSGCYEEKLKILAYKLLWCFISGSLSYIIMQFLPSWPVIVHVLINAILIMLSVSTQLSYKNLKSPFACKYIKVKQLSDIKGGDVIRFRYYGFQHYAICTRVSTSGKISFVHYKTHLFNRVIVEEELKWPDKTVWWLDLGKMTLFNPQEIISRVHARLGERKWNWHSNRSDHVSYWAAKNPSHWKYYKPVDTEEQDQVKAETEQITKSSWEVETVDIHLRSEIETGDVTKFSVKNGCIKNGVGIVVEIKDLEAGLGRDERRFQLSVVMQAGKSITQSLINIDLNTDTVHVKKFHPVHCCLMEERKTRALRAVSGQTNLSVDGKFKLVEFCVLKENDMVTLGRKKKN